MDSVGSGCLFAHFTYKAITPMYVLHFAYIVKLFHAQSFIFCHFTPSMPQPSSPWGKCMLQFLYAEDLPQLVWIDLTMMKEK